MLDGFRLTGANGYVTTDEAGGALVDTAAGEDLQPGMFFYSDGGAIKVFGNSSPRLENLIVDGNHSALCGGGVSIENRGFAESATLFRNCIFRDNHCPGTGAAVDVLENSVCEFRNCLFEANISNTGMDEIRKKYGLTYNPEHGCGALTVFPGSRVVVDRSTFVSNWNGADDKGDGSTYRGCIFWMNTATDGSRPGRPYEIDILNAQDVSDCWIHGEVNDLQGTVDPERNVLGAPDPLFDDRFQPQNLSYENVGYRPLNVLHRSTTQE